MPKVIAKHHSNPNSLIEEFGGPKVWEYNHKKKVLFCKLCAVSCEQGRKSLVRQHTQSQKHINKLKDDGPQQQLLQTFAISSNMEFATDLCKAFVASNIPLHKAESPAIQQLFQKYAKLGIPSRQTLTRIMEKESQEMMASIKRKLVGKALFLVADETTDATGRAMCALLAGPLDGSFLARPFLIDLADIGRSNNLTLQQFVTSGLFKLFGDDFDYNQVHLFLTDGAPYCLKAGLGLKMLFPNMIHITCLCHGLNRVAEKVRYSFPKVDKLIGEMKKVFVKCPRRRDEFTAALKIPLPPEPILTR